MLSAFIFVLKKSDGARGTEPDSHREEVHPGIPGLMEGEGRAGEGGEGDWRSGVAVGQKLSCPTFQKEGRRYSQGRDYKPDPRPLRTHFAGLDLRRAVLNH